MANRSDPSKGGHGSHRQRSGEATRLQIVRAVEEYWQLHRRSLTIREIGALVGLSSTGNVAYHVNALVEQERLRRLYRGMQIERHDGVKRVQIDGAQPLRFDQPNVIDQTVELVFRHKPIERSLRFHAVGQVDRHERSWEARVVCLACQSHNPVPVCVQPLCDGPADAFAGTGYENSA